MEGLDAVLDVGGEYDPSRDRYDHHQKGFEEVFGHGFKTKLSSAGLVYKVSLKGAVFLGVYVCVWFWECLSLFCVEFDCSILGRK